VPFDPAALRRAGMAEIQRIIREVEPPKPSTRLSTLGAELDKIASRRHTPPEGLGRLIRGDLDWIVMKCLEKDRGRRYETANALAEEIQRHLKHEPVYAGPPSAGYRLRKFVRRNRAGVVAGGLVATVVIAATVGMSFLTTWALRERSRAEEAARKALYAEAEQRRLADEARFQSDRANQAYTELVEANREAWDLRVEAARTEHKLTMKIIRRTILNGKVDTLRFDAVPITELAESLSEYCADLDFDWESLEQVGIGPDTAITLQVADVPLEEALYAIVCAAGGMDTWGFRVNSYGLLFASREVVEFDLNAAQQAPEFFGRYEVRGPDKALPVRDGLLARAPLVMFVEQPLGDVLDFLRMFLQVDCTGAWDELERIGISKVTPVSCAFAGEGARGVSILDEIAARLGGNEHSVAWCIDGDRAVVSSRAALQRWSEQWPDSAVARDVQRRIWWNQYPLDPRGVAWNIVEQTSASPDRYQLAYVLARTLASNAPRQQHQLLLGTSQYRVGRFANALETLQSSGIPRNQTFGGLKCSAVIAMSLYQLGRASDAMTELDAIRHAYRNGGESFGSVPSLVREVEVLIDPTAPTIAPASPEHVALHHRITSGRRLIQRGRFDEAEADLLGVVDKCERSDSTPDHLRKKTLNSLVELYTTWHAAEPGAGYDAKAAEWQAKLEVWQATTQPATSRPSTDPPTPPPS
jgi:hypothetical protein